MLDEHDINRLNNLCEHYEELLRPIQVSDYNSPSNRVEEKAKLFEAFPKGIEYNPQFEYRQPPQNWEQPLVSFLKELDPFKNMWERYLYQDIRRAILEIESVVSHNPSKITAETIHAHGMPMPELVEEAYRILNSTSQESEERNISAIEAAIELRIAIEAAGLTDWNIELKESMNAKMMVRSVEKKVFVRADATFSDKSVKRLLVHEIGTHVFRYINGERQPLKMLKLGLIGYLDTEEGLATYHEKKFDVQDITALRTYALRVIAANLSLAHGFYDIFSSLSQYNSDMDQIFDIVTRAKRGFKDTKQIGGHLKDQVYLKGFIDVSHHLSHYPKDYTLIMCGKVSLAMLPELRELEKNHLLVQPQFKPSDLVSEDHKN